MPVLSQPACVCNTVNGMAQLRCPSLARSGASSNSFECSLLLRNSVVSGKISGNNMKCGRSAISPASQPASICLLGVPVNRKPLVPRPLFTGNLSRHSSTCTESRSLPVRPKRAGIVTRIAPGIDPWAPSVDSQSIASSLFALSLLPYLGFLYHLTRSKTAPGLTLFGFYFLLAFVGATIPAGIYAKLHYGTSLSNVDWLHGSAESLLTLTNLFIVIGLQRALTKEEEKNKPKAPEAK